VQSLFGQTISGGSVLVSSPLPGAIIASARTYDDHGSGTYGQFIPAVTADQAIGVADRSLEVLQVEESERFRTNLGIAEVSGSNARVEVTAYVPDAKTTPTMTVNLQPHQFTQLTSVLSKMGIGTTYNARLSLRVVSGSGRITAYGSVIDNKTQDPTYVPAQ
jgi:hypothetical protein